MPKGEAILFINLSPFLPIDKKYPPSFNHLILSYSTLVHSSRLPMTGVWIAEHIEQSPDKQSRNLEQILLPTDEPDWKHWKVGAEAILDGNAVPKNWQSAFHQKSLPALTTGSPSTSSASASGPKTSPGTRQRRCARLSTETWPAFSARTRMHLYRSF